MAGLRITMLLVGFVTAVTSAGCDTSSPSSSSSSPSSTPPTAETAVAATVAAAPIAEVPVTLTLEQRSMTPIPGSDGQLSLTIDDITRGQVAVSILDADNRALAGPVSLTAGQTVPVRVEGTDYHLRLEKLSNALVGSDFATLVIDVASGSDTPDSTNALTELQKIEHLIEIVAAQENAAFLRNGTPYTPADAAEHLRTKLSAAGSRIQTAQDFIDQIASRSSVSGEEYHIRFEDGRTMSTREFLQQQLGQLEAK